jgi:hypothetical protein
METLKPISTAKGAGAVWTGAVRPARCARTVRRRASVDAAGTETGAESMWRSAWTKATFLAFCWISYLIFVGLGLLAYYLVHPRLGGIHRGLDLTAAIVIGGFLLVLGAGLFLISMTALTGLDLLYPHKKRSITVKALFPIAATLSQLVRFDRNRLRASFVKVNNALTTAQHGRIKGDRILVLLPHCLQIDVCNRKITTSIENCRRCGKCPVGSLVQLGEKYGLRLEVVNGGTLARKKVISFRPDGIVAVACERDLTLGIQDVYPIPVYGVINDRPHGPCLNTCVDMDLVENAVRFFRRDQRVAVPA